jgi:hypothetical protein
MLLSFQDNMSDSEPNSLYDVSDDAAPGPSGSGKVPPSSSFEEDSDSEDDYDFGDIAIPEGESNEAAEEPLQDDKPPKNNNVFENIEEPESFKAIRSTAIATVFKLLNQEIEYINLGIRYPDSNLPSSQVGMTVWSSEAKEAFFDALDTHGKGNLPRIAEAIGFSIPQVQEYLLLLEAANEEWIETYGSVNPIEIQEVPAAWQIPASLEWLLDFTSLVLSERIQHETEKDEKKRFGKYFIVDLDTADEIQKAYDVERQQDPQKARQKAASKAFYERRKLRSKSYLGEHAENKHDEDEEDEHTEEVEDERTEYEGDLLSEDEPDENAGGDHFQPPIDHDQVSHDGASEKEEDLEKLEILKDIPPAILLHVPNMLRLSRDVYMQRSHGQVTELNRQASMYGRQVSIQRIALEDFNTLVRSVTRRLVSTAIFQARDRVRTSARDGGESWSRVLDIDVSNAIDILNMQHTSFGFWIQLPRRIGLPVRCESLNQSGRKYTPAAAGSLESGIMPYDDVERFLSGSHVSQQRRNRYTSSLSLNRPVNSAIAGNAENVDREEQSDVESDYDADSPQSLNREATEISLKEDEDSSIDSEVIEVNDLEAETSALERFDRQESFKYVTKLCRALGISTVGLFAATPPPEDDALVLKRGLDSAGSWRDEIEVTAWEERYMSRLAERSNTK